MEFLLYLLKVNVAIILFYGFYRLFFQQDTFYRWKRMALLAIVFISLSYPFVDIARKSFLTETVENVLLPVYTLPEVIVGAPVAGQAVSFTHYLPQLLFILYGMIVVLLLGRLWIQTGVIIRMMRGTQKTELYGQTVYRNEEVKTPFSFFRWIVLNPALYTDTELQEILQHEETHVREAHSIDTLLAELLCVFCWFNPFAWLLKREIRMNLEFLADHSVLASGYEAEHYQFHLLRLTYHKAAAKITNNFNVSLLKKRIFMMNKKQTSKLSIFKYTLLIPVIGALVLFNGALKVQAGAIVMNETALTSEPVITDEAVTDESVTTVRTDKLIAQNTAPQKKNDEKPQVLPYSEVLPSFPGGEKALLEFLANNLMYPVAAAEQGIQGRVIVRFTVNANGSVTDISVMRSEDSSLDKEAIRVVEKMPKWEPGKQGGQAVAVYYTLPILFKLPEDTSTTNTATYTTCDDRIIITALAPTNTTDKIVEPVIVDANGKVITENVIYIIDGKEIPQSELPEIDPKTIESITVLKDKNATSIYGARAANGVVLITTKSGKSE